MKFSRHLYAILGLVTILSALGMSAGRATFAPPAGTQDVKVTNTAANPVPTMSMGGTVAVSTIPPVTVSGTPNVNVANTPNVNLANGATVKVNNSSNSPIPVTVVTGGGSARQFISKMTNAYLEPGFGNNYTQMYTVPAGKRLLIKDLHVHGETPVGQTIIGIEFSDQGNGHYWQFAVPTSYQGTFSGTTSNTGMATNCTLELYEGDVLQVSCTRSATTGTAGYWVGFTGYLEDAN